jgi:hypothetical protein
MCIICQEWEKQKLTSKEVFRAIGEMMTPENQTHLEQLSEKILQKEVPETESNQQADEDWWNATHSED